MKMSEDERQCLSESRGGLLMSFLFLVIARVAIDFSEIQGDTLTIKRGHSKP